MTIIINRLSNLRFLPFGFFSTFMSVFIFPYVYISPLPLFLFISSLWIALIIFYSCVNITAMREYKEWKSRAEIRSDWVILTCFLSLSVSLTLSLADSHPSRSPHPLLFLSCCLSPSLSLAFAVC